MDSTHEQHPTEGGSEGTARRRSLALFVLVAACLSWPSCGGRSERPGTPPRHVLLVTCERVRADHMTGLGYDRETTGFVKMDQPYVLDFDYLGQNGVTFANAMAPCSDDGVSIARLLTGAMPVTAGRLDAEGAPPAEWTTLAEDFAAQGFQTVAFVNSHSLSAVQQTEAGFGRGFAHAEFCPTDNAMLTAAATWLGANATSATPNFVWLHFAGIDVPFEGEPFSDQLSVQDYAGPVVQDVGYFYELLEGGIELSPVDRSRLRDLYDGSLSRVTSLMNAFFYLYRYTFAQGSLWDDTVIVFMGTSGCELAEKKGRVAARNSLVDAGLRVPLQFWHPPSLTGARIFSPVVALTDVNATLRDWFELEPRAHVQGESLLALTDSYAPREFHRRSSLALANSASDELSASLRTDRWRYVVEGGEEELYDVAVDRKSLHNRTLDSEVVAKKMRAELSRQLEELGLKVPPFPANMERDGDE